MPQRNSYAPLGIWLAAQRGGELTVTFGDIERILGHRLPPTAWSSGSWWRQVESRRLATGRIWRAAGWRVVAVDRRATTVTFQRAPTAEPAPLPAGGA